MLPRIGRGLALFFGTGRRIAVAYPTDVEISSEL